LVSAIRSPPTGRFSLFFRLSTSSLLGRTLSTPRRALYPSHNPRANRGSLGRALRQRQIQAWLNSSRITVATIAPTARNHAGWGADRCLYIRNPSLRRRCLLWRLNLFGFLKDLRICVCGEPFYRTHARCLLVDGPDADLAIR